MRIQTAPHGTYNGVLDCVSKIVTHEGPFAFYKGTMMPLMGVGACVSVQFAVVQDIKRRFSHANEARFGSPHLSDMQLYTAGAAAGLANSVIAAPVEHIRIRMQTQRNAEFKGPVDCLMRCVASNQHCPRAWDWRSFPRILPDSAP